MNEPSELRRKVEAIGREGICNRELYEIEEKAKQFLENNK